MSSAPPRIVVYCGADDDWPDQLPGACRRRNLHLLDRLARHPEVAAVYAPRQVSLSSYRSAAAAARRTRRTAADDRPLGVPLDVPFARPLPEPRRLRGLWRLNRALARRLARPHLPSAGNGEPVVWCYQPRGFRQADYLGLGLPAVYDLDHNLVGDTSRIDGRREDFEATLERQIARSTLVLSSVRSMLDWMAARGLDNGHRLRNAADTDRLGGTRTHTAARTAGRRATIGYLGVFSPWVDFDLFREVVRRTPSRQWLLAGFTAGMELPRGLFDEPNVSFLGYRPAAEVGGLLKQIDVGAVLYRREPWLDLDSMKIFDYLAAGVPVVSTPFHPYLGEDFDGLVVEADGAEDFVAAIDRVLDRDAAARDDWQQRRRQFVERQTWSRRVGDTIALLDERLGGGTDPATRRDPEEPK